MQWLSTSDDAIRGNQRVSRTKSNQKDQLEFKKNTITKAFQRYFGSNLAAIPPVDSTHPSPLLYGYRTKITPHFEIPRSRSKESQGQCPTEIGFLEKGRRRILDIEGELCKNLDMEAKFL